MKEASEKTIERISMYRRLLEGARGSGKTAIYSHDIAELIGGTAAQVRRDLMEIGCGGSPKRGYDIDRLIESIGDFLDNEDIEKIALIGVGNLGRALLQFFTSHHPRLKIVAAFDADPRKAGRVIHGCRCYPAADMSSVLVSQSIAVAILAVPAEAAQPTVSLLEKCGIKGILNFVPEPLRVNPVVVVENMDMTMALEKVAYLARHRKS